MTPRLRAESLKLGYGDSLVFDGLDLDVIGGTVTAVIGPNGCGKSTLLRAMGRLLAPRGGQVLLDGKRIDKMPTREVAKVLGVLPQSPQAPEGLTVADRTLDQLSGGQRQRAWISMALAQGTELLLLDEPTTYLDLAHQVDVLDLVQRMHSELGRTVVMVLHDINLAARYADRLVALRAGKVVAQGRPHDVLTEELLRDVFDLEAKVIDDPVAGTPLVVPIGTRHRT